MTARRRWGLRVDPDHDRDNGGVLAAGNVVRGVALPAGAYFRRDEPWQHLVVEPSPAHASIVVAGQSIPVRSLHFKRLRDVVSAVDGTWLGWALAVDRLFRDPDVEVVLASPSALDGFTLPAGSRIGLRNGTLVAIEAPEGAMLGPVPGPCRARLRRDGTLADAELQRDGEVGGWPCLRYRPIRFDRGGRVRAFSASRDLTVQGTDVRAGSVVALDAKGQVRRVRAPPS